MADITIIGAGRIGVPWGAVLAADLDHNVTYVDIDENRVSLLNEGRAPFAEPRLEEYLEAAVEAGKLSATTSPTPAQESEYVAFTVNAPRKDMHQFTSIVEEYASGFGTDQFIINRSTLPVAMVSRMREIINESSSGEPSFITFPERLAEGSAIEEIKTLPKIIGTDGTAGRDAMSSLLEGLDCLFRFIDPETAMFVKLIDNAYRDALFAISNQIAYTADELDLDAQEAISLANEEYPRNEIASPGPVGGKCLPKDPHFLTDEWVCDQPTTPDLFTATRRTNAFLTSYVSTQIIRQKPSRVALLGQSYKGGVGDTYNSPAAAIANSLTDQGFSVSTYDPFIDENGSIKETIEGADVVVLATNHAEFRNSEEMINSHSATDATVYDLWGMVDRTKLKRRYDGFGIS